MGLLFYIMRFHVHTIKDKLQQACNFYPFTEDNNVILCQSMGQDMHSHVLFAGSDGICLTAAISRLNDAAHGHVWNY